MLARTVAVEKPANGEKCIAGDAVVEFAANRFDDVHDYLPAIKHRQRKQIENKQVYADKRGDFEKPVNTRPGRLGGDLVDHQRSAQIFRADRALEEADNCHDSAFHGEITLIRGMLYDAGWWNALQD